MATELDLSRNTVVNAFEQLIAEGYLEGQVGAGTYVARELPDALLLRRSRAISPLQWTGQDHILSRRGRVLATLGATVRQDPGPLAFQLGLPALDHFPTGTWTRLMTRRWRSATTDIIGLQDPLGYRPLREVIAGYLAATRGLHCEADQIIMVSGAQQALDLVMRVLLNPGDPAWMEDPGYIGARAALLGNGARLVPVPVDEQGLDVEAGIRRCPEARLAYVTPSHQFPLGMTMSLPRRLALLEWASRANAWIIEDDYESEYRYSGRPLSALQGLDTQQQVIYLGTFSKVLFPALRLGYMVVPPYVVDAFASARAVASRFPPSIEQAVVADFIDGGYFARHIRAMRVLYAERQATLVESIRRDADGLLRVEACEAGIQLMAWLPDGVLDRAVAERVRTLGVKATPLSDCTVEYFDRDGLALGYAAASPAEIREGVRKLVMAILEVTTEKQEGIALVPNTTL